MNFLFTYDLGYRVCSSTHASPFKNTNVTLYASPIKSMQLFIFLYLYIFPLHTVHQWWFCFITPRPSSMYIRFMFEAGVKNLISTLRCYCCSFYRPLGTKLRLGWSSQFNVGRLFRFWDPSKIKKDGEFMGITLFLLYEKVSTSSLYE